MPNIEFSATMLNMLKDRI